MGFFLTLFWFQGFLGGKVGFLSDSIFRDVLVSE